MLYPFVLSLCFVSITSVHSQFLELEKIESYRGCRFDRDCLPNSFCFGNDNDRAGVCKCMDGFELERNETFYECYIPSGLGGNCTQDYHCEEKMGDIAECDQKSHTCGCREDAHSAPDGMCYKTAKLTEICRVDKNCLLKDGSFAFCVDGRCTCPLKHRPSKDKMTCIPSKDLGEKCNADRECEPIENAVCRVVCECAVGATVSKDGMNCLKAATEFGEPCIENDQCSRYLYESICQNNVCTCVQGYHGYLTKCVKSVELNGICYDKSECIHNKSMIGLVDCIKQTCQCVHGLGPKGCTSIGCSDSAPIGLVILFILFLIFE